jgi:succinate dehydrogenase / fumarate reductase cytochrome b subunit
MRSLALAFRSSTGQKLLAGISGLFLSGWVSLHALGSLSALRGPSVMDGYARLLRGAAGGIPLWVLRVLLLSALLVHVSVVVDLTRRAHRARPIGYHDRGAHGAARRAWGLRLGGVLLAAFLVYHVLQLNAGLSLSHFVPDHVYANLLQACASPLAAVAYVAAAVVLGAHVAHGFGAAFASLGLLAPKHSRVAASIFGVVLGVAFSVAPLAIAVGWLS